MNVFKRIELIYLINISSSPLLVLTGGRETGTVWNDIAVYKEKCSKKGNPPPR